MFELSVGWRKTLCPYCGVGCGLLVQIEDGTVKKVKGDPEHPSSLGDVCAKAVHLPPALRTPDRLLYPQVRTRRDAELSRVPWELAVRKLAAPDEVAVIVADPRFTETADIADLHLPLRPGSDIALLNAMLHVLWKDGLLDRHFIEERTRGWAQLLPVIARYTPERAAALTGLSPEIIAGAARRFGGARAAMTLWSMGINQSHIGTDKNAAILNLHLATGQIARPGAGPFSLTGQPNAMGGRETGGLAHLLPGYRQVTDAAARATVERHWGVPAGRIASSPGRAALEIFEGLREGSVRAVWIICTNPAASMPDLDLVEKALRQAELVIVQDAYHPT